MHWHCRSLFFFSSRRRHTRLQGDLEFRRVLFRSLDARRVVVAQWGPLGPGIQWAESRANLEALVPVDFSGTLLLSGVIASNQRGVQTTLGRNGSDFSASIFGALLGAAEIHIWTDVDGVLSADPRRVPDATVIDSLSYSEAMELAYFGAKVLHPQTMAPAVKDGIPIWIRKDRKSTRLNSSHLVISYAVFCLKKKLHADALHVDAIHLGRLNRLRSILVQGAT